MEDGWPAWRRAGLLADELHAERLATDQREAEMYGESAKRATRSRTPAVRLTPAQPKPLPVPMPEPEGSSPEEELAQPLPGKKKATARSSGSGRPVIINIS